MNAEIPQEQGDDLGRWHKTQSLVLAMLLLATAVCAGGYYAFRENRAAIQEEVQQDLQAMARLKVGQIAQWRSERLADARIVSGSIFFIREVERWLRDGAPADSRRANLDARLVSFLEGGQYRAVFLVDGDGRAHLAAGRARDLPEYERLLAVTAINARRAMFFDLPHRGDGIETDLVAPLVVRDSGQAHAVGAIVFEIDPEPLLYPLIRWWPEGTPTAETLLVRREGGDAVWLSPPRSGNGKPLALRIPLSRVGVPGVRAALGMEGVMEGLDYRGVPVVAATLGITGSSWAMVSKIDRDQLYTPVSRLQRWALALGAAFLGLGTAFVALWAKGQQSRYQSLQALYRAEAQGRAFAQRYETLAKCANDIMVVMDGKGRIVDANDRAVSAYGYAREDLLQLSAMDLRPPELPMTPEVLERRKKTMEGGEGVMHEAIHRRHDGSVFPVEISGRMVEAEGKKFYLGMIRDITERKQAEAALRRYAEEVEDLYNRAPVGYHSLDKDGLVIRMNDTELGWLGYTREEVVGRMSWPDLLAPDSAVAFHESYMRFKELGWVHNLESRLRRKDGTILPILLSATVVCDGDGNFLMTRSTAYDITERKRAELRVTRLGSLYATLSRSNEAIARSTDRQALFDEICRIAVTDGQFKLAWVGLVDAEGGQVSLVASAGEAQDYARGLRLSIDPGDPAGRGPVGTAIRENRVYVANDFLADPCTGPWHATAEAHGIRGSAAFPLRADGRTVGALTLYAEEVDFFDQERTELLARMAMNISFALDYFVQDAARRRAEEALAESHASLARAQRIAHIGSFEWDVRKNESHRSDELYRIFGTVRPPDGAAGREDFLGVVHPDDREGMAGEIAEALRKGRGFSAEFRILRPDGGLRFVHNQVEVAVDESGRAVKLFGTVQDITERKRAEEELRLSRQRLRELAGHLESAKEEERTRISREIHDEFGQFLSGLKLNIGWLGTKLAAEGHSLAPKVSALGSMVDQAIESARGITARLRPRMLDQLGIVAAIEWQANEFSRQTGIGCDLDLFDGDLSLGGVFSTTLFRVLQEALTNVARHAEASRVEIVLEIRRGVLALRVKDNGRGFDLVAARAGRSFGLLGMQERALMVGGTVNIKTAPGSGTKVSLRMPLPVSLGEG